MSMNPNISNKMLGAVFAVIAIVLSVLIYQQRDRGFEDRPVTLEERQERAVKIGELAFAQAVTNIVGWRRTLATSSFIFRDLPVSNWWATARVEIINPRGGVEALDLRFIFGQHGSTIACSPVSSDSYRPSSAGR